MIDKRKNNIKKDITFIYMDDAEKAIYMSIAEEACKRGYEIKFTQDKFCKCEIGFYCQHINFPQYSKLSIIMFHDIIQQYRNWPDIWLREPWNKYDIGILPSNQWVENWEKCSQYYYANPRCGVYKIGWPKADRYADLNKNEFKIKFNLKHGLDNNKKTVLYAPSWENDGKQDDFVRSMLTLDVNILIKQASVDPDKYHDMSVAINEMYQLHKNIPQVTILDPATNIIEAIIASDILVSEESSTMCEAVMMGIPAISVSDWLIPDVIPKRYPECNYNFVFMTQKDKLADCVQSMLKNYSKTLEQVEIFRRQTFGEIGGAAIKIMDIIDDCIMGNAIRYKSIQPSESHAVPFKQYLFHIYTITVREFAENYCQKSKICNFFFQTVLRTKHLIDRKTKQ